MPFTEAPLPVGHGGNAADTQGQRLLKHPALAAALLMMIALVVYQPALECGFIWDDECLTENVWLRSPEGLGRLWTGDVLAPKDERWWPLNYTVFAVQYRIWGLAPAGYHLFNVLLHGLNGVLIFLLLRRLRVPGGWLAGALFIIHPAHGQSAAWIMDLKTILSTCLALLTLGAYLDFFERRRWTSWILALLLFALGMLSKASLLVLPAALVPVLWWRSGGRIRNRVLLELAPMAVVGLLLFLLGSYLAQAVPHYEDPRLGPAERLLVAGRAFWFYVAQFVWPVQLMMLPPRWSVDAGSALQWLFPAAAAAAGLAVWGTRRRLGRGPVAAVLFFVLCLLPTLGLVRFSYQRLSFVAGRYAYLADVSLVTLAGASIALSFSKLSDVRRRRVLQGGIAALLLALGLISWNQTRAFRTNLTLFARDLAIDPSSWGARYQVAHALAAQGRTSEAIDQYQTVIIAAPDFSNAHIGLGHTWLQAGYREPAIRSFRNAVQSDPADSVAHFNLGILLADAGSRAEGLSHLERAVRLEPGSPDIHLTLGAYLAEDGRTTEALQHFREAVRLAPGNPAARQNLERLLREMQQQP